MTDGDEIVHIGDQYIRLSAVQRVMDCRERGHSVYDPLAYGGQGEWFDDVWIWVANERISFYSEQGGQFMDRWAAYLDRRRTQ